MKKLCGCCAGIESITPIPNANRPGLGALAYRVGTHATFLETMLARLASHRLHAAEEETGSAETNVQPLRPLQSLTTRDAGDASIAFLDAWATVADVLTFYQERIANEGYLRTATERRSVAELARLIGYEPRPGVAASVHLAYTLDDEKEVDIPAGSRAQSVPGPGELPQTFETAEDLYAHADWNLLPPRLKRPQAVRPQEFATEGALYFKGTATNLKANDPLLIDFGKATMGFFRVIEVLPDQAADHTKVILRPWLQTPPAPPPTAFIAAATTAASAPETSAANEVRELRQTIERHRRAEEFGVNASTQTAQQVLSQLEGLEDKLAEGMSQTELRQVLQTELASLREKHRLAVEGNFTKLEPWLGSIVSELEPVAERLAAFAERASLTGLATNLGTIGGVGVPREQQTTEPSLAQLTPLFESLEKPASRPPASKQQLGTNLTENLSSASGALPQLLTAMRPSLASVLYNAWRNVPATEATEARVYALRTRASVFGHNAPLKPVIDDNGRITRYEEWTLFSDTGLTSREHFTIGIRFSQTGGEIPLQTIITTVDLAPPTPPAHGTATEVLSNHSYNISLPTAGGETVAVTLSNISPNSPQRLTVTFQFRVRRISVIADRNDRGEWTITSAGSNPTIVSLRLVTAGATGGQGNTVTIEGDLRGGAGQRPTEEANKVSLDATFNKIVPGGWAILERHAPLGGSPTPLVIAQVVRATESSRADYGMTAKGTRLQLSQPWIAPVDGGDEFRVIRETSVFAESELLELAEAPLDPIKNDLCGDRIELAELVPGLEPGRWLIVAGERTDVRPRRLIRETIDGGSAETRDETRNSRTEAGRNSMRDGGNRASREFGEAIVPGINATELVMLAGVEQGYDEKVSGDKTHTTLLLAESLAYCYKLDTVRIYGNVVRATHGETKNEILGSGDASQSMQSFTLKQTPLTYISAPTPTGIESTLQVRAGDILWHKTDTLAGLTPQDRKYVTQADDESKTTITFGNGREGARPPTGAENIKATYRVGIGKGGNVKAEQIITAVSKPLGVKEVINPLAATGGADRESRDDARRNAPLAVMSLDRLVSTRDYEDFARTFAGVGKASAARLSDGRRQLVHLTIAGADDIPISTDSDLYRNLLEACRRFGDPYQPVQLATRFLKLLVIAARVRVHPDHLWETVEPKIRAALLDRFSFNERALGLDVTLSEVIAGIQNVEGILYVDVDTLDAVDEDITTNKLLDLTDRLRLRQRIAVHLARVDKKATAETERIRPAELALLTPLVPETLNLTELKG